MSEEEAEKGMRMEHFDEGMASSEMPYYRALWEIRNDEAKRKGGK